MGLLFQKPSSVRPRLDLPSMEVIDRLELADGVVFEITVSPSRFASIYSYSLPGGHDRIVVGLDGGPASDLSGDSSQSSGSTEKLGEKLIKLYLKYGPEGIFRITEAASAILYDTRSSTIILYSTALVGNPLYYSYRNRSFSAATNPAHLLGFADIPGALNDVELARLFALDFTTLRGSFFSDLEALPHGGMVVVSPVGLKQTRRSWVFGPPGASPTCDADAAREYKGRLNAAIGRLLRPGKRYGIMLSSGVDSSSVAVLAARHLKESGSGLHAYSWSLPGDKSGDETDRIRELCACIDIPLTLLNGEMLGPFDSEVDRFLVPDTPYVNPFSLLTEACYKAASRDGVGGLFNGNYADLLFPSPRWLLSDLIRDRKLERAAIEIAGVLKRRGLSRVHQSPEVRGILSRCVPYRRKRHNPTSEWLTADAQRTRSSPPDEQPEKQLHGRQDQYSTLSCWIQAGYLGIERYSSGRFGIARLEPHRDRDLVNYCLQLPAYYSYRDGMDKWFAREAIFGLVPEPIRTQHRVGDLSGMTVRSLRRNLDRVREDLFAGDMEWARFVKEGWMRTKLREVDKLMYRDIFVIWNCWKFCAWTRAIGPAGQLRPVGFRGGKL